MGFRFRRSVKLLPGVRLNVSKSGPSVSLGGRGFHYTIGAKGTRVTAGIPGTGLSWSEYTPHKTAEIRDVSPPPVASYSDPDRLQLIQNATAAQISAFSTSHLAPILNHANNRPRLAPAILVVCIILFIVAVGQASQTLISQTALLGAVFIPGAVVIDRYRRSVRVKLDPGGVVGRISEALASAFAELRQCKAIWIVNAEGRTTDWKRNAGATSLNRRTSTSLRFGKPDCIRGRVKLPAFHVGADQLYLLPDEALAVVRGQVASVSYQELHFHNTAIRFIEDQGSPSDTQVVDYTWRYVNKSGGPDRRFTNNAQLPICLYGELAFTSAGGLNCKLHVSNPQAAEPLYKVIESLKRTSVEIPTPVTYIKTAKRWPTATFVSIFSLFALLQAGFLVSFYSQQQVTGSRPSTAREVVRPSPEPSAKVSENAPSFQAQNVSPDLKSPSAAPDSATPPTVTPSPEQPLDLSDPQNVFWVQSRLRELGFLRGPTKGWDSFSRSAFRDFKAMNNLTPDDKWDFESENLLASGQALHVEQTFVGSWSEAACEPGSRPDIYINSRRAVSSAGGICEFSNIRGFGPSWTVSTVCLNAGEKWKATIQLTMNGNELVWTGRNGSQTHYERCGPQRP